MHLLRTSYYIIQHMGMGLINIIKTNDYKSIEMMSSMTSVIVFIYLITLLNMLCNDFGNAAFV